MKLSKWKFIKDRLYEFYLNVDWKSFVLAICIADVDFQIHLVNCRELKED